MVCPARSSHPPPRFPLAFHRNKASSGWGCRGRCPGSAGLPSAGPAAIRKHHGVASQPADTPAFATLQGFAFSPASPKGASRPLNPLPALQPNCTRRRQRPAHAAASARCHCADMAGSKRKQQQKTPHTIKAPDWAYTCAEEGFYYPEVAARPLFKLAGMASRQPG